ncbi:hypothetical protein SUGI_0792590 [Cryptomeria japonica]|nr:hypothetical protein SUGI_0792590 [Cryptomeria japonica]
MIIRASRKGSLKASLYKRVIKRCILKQRRERKLNLLYARLRAIIPKPTKATKPASLSQDFSDCESCSSSLMADLTKGL